MWKIVVNCGSKWNAGAARRFGYLEKVELMFLGQYEHSIDEKGRMTIPVRYRDQIQEGAYITLGFDNNLIVMTAVNFEQMYESLNNLSMTNADARHLKRLVFSKAYRLEIDKSGRILIPQYLRDGANLDNSAILVGVGDRFEIWSPTLWEEQDQEILNAENNSKRFSALDISV